MQQASQLQHTIGHLPLQQSQPTAHQRQRSRLTNHQNQQSQHTSLLLLPQRSLLTTPHLSSRSLNIGRDHSLQDLVPATLLLHQSQSQATLRHLSKSPATDPNQHRVTSLNLQSPVMVLARSRQGSPVLLMDLQGLLTNNKALNWSSSRGLQSRVTTRHLQRSQATTRRPPKSQPTRSPSLSLPTMHPSHHTMLQSLSQHILLQSQNHPIQLQSLAMHLLPQNPATLLQPQNPAMLLQPQNLATLLSQLLHHNTSQSQASLCMYLHPLHLAQYL